MSEIKIPNLFKIGIKSSCVIYIFFLIELVRLF